MNFVSAHRNINEPNISDKLKRFVAFLNNSEKMPDDISTIIEQLFSSFGADVVEKLYVSSIHVANKLLINKMDFTIPEVK